MFTFPTHRGLCGRGTLLPLLCLDSFVRAEHLTAHPQLALLLQQMKAVLNTGVGSDVALWMTVASMVWLNEHVSWGVGNLPRNRAS